MEDTIAAISTALGVGAISIIRVSGNEAIPIVNKIFKGKNLEKVPSHTINYGHIVNGEKVIDEVLVSVMRAPKTFTSEDTVEINCHGGIAPTNKILELLLSNGCRLADPGEFTKRAFLNGRIDLIEAEGVMDLINSKTEQARNLAINQLSGKVSSLIRNLRQEIIEILANIEVNIDYPEYEDIEELTNQKLVPKIEKVKEEIKKIIKESENGKIIKEGIKTVIVGRPNVGKSSILNKLINEEKAIVTEIEGTTRDIVEGSVNINGIILNIIDTAGIRKTEDIVEKIGVSKSLELIDKADLILYVLNNNQKLTDDDRVILEKIKNKNHIIIINKIDLENKLDIKELENRQIVYMSAINNEGIDDLKQKIKEIFNLEKIMTSDFTYLTNARSISLLKQCLKVIKEIEDGINQNNSIDMIEIDIKRVWSLLGEIIGETYDEELIDQIFKQFCLGK
ncbi:MAG: tRNA uridine-5-carboxymethylaminomethyl(34) synthesis GTPase MnmE [Mollicutes bacterium]|nr:tRNA uridine-5-carboxymethylaminomethyl(34) synthesis GTPase MnmE [Mollicutes bacterium]